MPPPAGPPSDHRSAPPQAPWRGVTGPVAGGGPPFARVRRSSRSASTELPCSGRWGTGGQSRTSRPVTLIRWPLEVAPRLARGKTCSLAWAGRAFPAARRRCLESGCSLKYTGASHHAGRNGALCRGRTAVATTRTISARYGPNKLHRDLGRRRCNHLLRSYPLLPLLDGPPPQKAWRPRSEAGPNTPIVDGAHHSGRAEARDSRACLR